MFLVNSDQPKNIIDFLFPAFPSAVKIPVKITVKNNRKTSNFDIKISLPEISYTISSKTADILHLESKISSDFSSTKLEIPVSIPKIAFSEQNPSKTAFSIELFFQFFFENEALLSHKIVQFLQIPNPYRRKFLKKIQEKTKKFEDFTVNNSLSSHVEESETSVSEASDKHFCVFFLIEYLEFRRIGTDHVEFMFLVSFKGRSSQKQWTISKRYNDFVKFEEILTREIKRNLPKLPGKQLFHSEENLSERSAKLEGFMRTLLNETVYFCDILLNFIDFYGNSEENHSVFQWNFEDFPNIRNCYKGFQAKDFESKISFENNETQFVLYIINIEELGKFRCKIGKRYSDFEKLHKALILRFENEGKLPELPGKLDFLGGSQIKSRGQRLVDYLNRLFGTNEVEDCFAFRKFIGIEVKNLVI